MKWKKTIILFSLLSVFVPVFFSSPSYAIEDKSITYPQGHQYVDWDNIFPDCYDACLSQYKYLKVETSGYPSTGYSESVNFRLRNEYSGAGSNWNFLLFYKTMPVIISLNMPDNFQYGVLSFMNSGTLKESLTFTLMEDYQDCPEVEPCPEVPENPYDDKLDKIIQAIYVVAGTLLVIYFFYCIYRMIIKPLGGN